VESCRLSLDEIHDDNYSYDSEQKCCCHSNTLQKLLLQHSTNVPLNRQNKTHKRWKTMLSMEVQLCSESQCFKYKHWCQHSKNTTPRYSWNIAKVGKHQSILVFFNTILTNIEKSNSMAVNKLCLHYHPVSSSFITWLTVKYALCLLDKKLHIIIHRSIFFGRKEQLILSNSQHHVSCILTLIWHKCFRLIDRLIGVCQL
jgi:hypothetical protein